MARALVAELPASARTLALGYDSAIPAGHAIGDRIAVNARDAGLTVQVSPQNSQSDVSLVELRLSSLDAARALVNLAPVIGLEALQPVGPSSEALYVSERRLLEDFRVIPLFHLPEFYGAGSRVRVFQPPAVTRMGDWRFENVWLSGTAP